MDGKKVEKRQWSLADRETRREKRAIDEESEVGQCRWNKKRSVK